MKSHLIQALSKEKKTQMTLLLLTLKSEVMTSLDTMRDERKNCKKGEEILKERNYDLDEKLCQQVLGLIKQVTSQFDYGKNKCD